MKILKNITNSAIDLKYIGIYIPANTSRTVEISDYGILASNNSIAELTTYISTGDIVINDGNRDLSVAEALIFITYPENASAILFNNLTNGFNSKTVQEAIEELKVNSDKALLTIQLVRSGSTSDGWLSLGDSSIYSNQSPFRPLIDFKVKSVFFSNNYAPNNTIRLKCYSQSKDATGDISTSSTFEFEINSDEVDTTANASNRIWNYVANTTNHILSNKQYGFKISLDGGGWFSSINDSHIVMVLEEV